MSVFSSLRHTHWQVHIGSRRILGRGLPARRLLEDLFHHFMSIGWGQLLLWYVIYSVSVNLSFSLLYWCVPGSVTGSQSPGWLDLLFFSFEVFGTVSFGGLMPGNAYGHALATIEIMLGIGSFAVMTGLSFARFTRPRANLLFARHPVIGKHNARPALMLRVANSRHNALSDAQAKLWFIANREYRHGRSRSFDRLLLERDESPLFSLSWSLYHYIDEHSPLYGLTADDLTQMHAGLMLILRGHDEHYGQEVQARHYYDGDTLRWHHRYVDLFSSPAPGVEHVDFGLFHETVPLPRED